MKTQFGWHLLQVLAERYMFLFSCLCQNLNWDFCPSRPAAKLVQVSVEEFAEKLAVLDPEEVQLVDVRETSEMWVE